MRPERDASQSGLCHSLTSPTIHRRRSRLAVHAYGLVLVTEIVAQSLWHSHLALGVMVAAALIVAAICAILDTLPFRDSLQEPLDPVGVFFVCALIAIGLYMTVVGLFLNNNRYFLAADVFHWFGELVAMSLLGIWVFRRSSAEDIHRFILNLSLLLGVVGLMIVVSGSLGLPLAGGHKIRSLGLWRLEIGRVYPALPLLLVLAGVIWRPPGQVVPWTRLSLCVLVLTVSLVFTFKRTQWIGLLLVTPLLIVPKRRMAVAAYFGGLSTAILILLATGFPKHTQRIATWLGDTLTYNSRFTVSESLEQRIRQLEGLQEYLAAAHLGAGLGAEYVTYVPKTKTFHRVHYVHNLYWYYTLQMGVTVALLSLALSGCYLYMLWHAIDVSQSHNGLVRASLCGLALLAFSGITLLSTHTAFAGFVVALSLLARQRGATVDTLPVARNTPVAFPKACTL